MKKICVWAAGLFAAAAMLTSCADGTQQCYALTYEEYELDEDGEYSEKETYWVLATPAEIKAYVAAEQAELNEDNKKDDWMKVSYKKVPAKKCSEGNTLFY